MALGFKQATVKWEWVRLGVPSFEREVANYVRTKRFATRDPQQRWAGLGVTLLGYERPEEGARGLLWRFYLDLDAEGDLERARAEAVKALDGFEKLGIEPVLRFSGSKGFGLQVAGRDFHRLGFTPDAHLVGKALHNVVVDEFGLDTSVVDPSLWATRKLVVRLGVPHPKTGLYAVPLTPDELRRLSIADIKSLAAAPRTLPHPKARWSEGMNALFERARVEGERSSSSPVAKPYAPRPKGTSGPKKLTVEDVPGDIGDVRSLLRGLTPCIRDLARGPVRDIETRRNSLTTALARWTRANEVSRDDAVVLVRRLLQTRTRFGSSWSEAAAAVEQTMRWAYSSEPDFSPATCSTIRSFGLACTDACPFHADYTLASGPHGRRQLAERDEDFVPPDPPAYTTITEARADIERTVRRVVDEGGAWLLAIPPGAGKSRTTLTTAVEWARDATEDRRILYLAPRHELIQQANEWTAGAFVHIRPREPSSCERSERAGEVSRRGFRADRWVCPSCPRFRQRDCGYWSQWRDRDTHWAMTYDMAAGLDLADMGFHLVVMDEAVVPHASRVVEVDARTVAETWELAFPHMPLPDEAGPFELGLVETEAGRAWRALVKGLRAWSPSEESRDRGAAAAERVAQHMVGQGVADPEAALRALLDAGFSYAEEAELQPASAGSGQRNPPLLLPPTDWIETTLRVLVEGLEQRRLDPTRTGGVPLRVDADPVAGWLLVAGRRREFELGDVPVVHLDGTGDAKVVERVLGRPVEEVRYRMALGPDQVVQITDAKYARSTVFTPTGKINARTMKRIVGFLEARCPEARTREGRPGRTLIVTYKNLAPMLLAKDVLTTLGGPSRVSVTWYGGNRGTDYADHDQVIPLGYPYPNEESVLDAATVLYEGEDLDTSVTEVWRPYLHGDQKTGLKVRVFADPRVQAVCEQIREAEFYQSLMRIRPLENPWKRVVLLTQVPALPKQDVVLAGLHETTELFGEASRARSIKEAVDNHVRRMVRKMGWTGCRWIADLCLGGVSPKTAIEGSNSGSGGNLPSPTVALLPEWGAVIETIRKHHAEVPFDVEGGKRLHRLRDLFEACLVNGLDALTLTVMPEPPPPTGGKPWTDVIYCDGSRGQAGILRRVRQLLASGSWRVDIDGARVDGGAVDRLLADAELPDAASSDDRIARWADRDEYNEFEDPEYREWLKRVTAAED